MLSSRIRNNIKNHQKNRVCVICEGNEEFKYLNRLKQLNLFEKIKLDLNNAKSINEISRKYSYYSKLDGYDYLFCFMDTELSPFDQYNNQKLKINNMIMEAQDYPTIIYANPCTLQIVIKHFDDVKIKNNSKTNNAKLIEKYTGIKNYHAKQNQLNNFMHKINKENYLKMKKSIGKYNKNEYLEGSTNFIELLNVVDPIK